MVNIYHVLSLLYVYPYTLLHFYCVYFVARLNLFSADQYHYLNQSGCYGDPTINDVQDFINVKVCILAVCVCVYVYAYACVCKCEHMYVCETIVYICAMHSTTGLCKLV